MFENLCLKRPLAVLDLETTGTDPSRDRVVEAAVLRLAPGGKRRTLCLLVNPGVPIPPAAAAVHGIRDADVAGRPPFAKVACRLARFLDGCDLCGFGLKRFDLPLLAAEFGRAGVPFRVAGRRVVDAMEIFHAREPRDLAAAHRLYAGSELAGAHRADADVRATVRVLDGMLGRHPDLPRTVGGLHRGFAGPDVAGRFRAEAGGAVFAFGKHRGEAVDRVAREDPGYLRWLLGADFLDDAKAIARDALRRAGETA